MGCHRRPSRLWPRYSKRAWHAAHRPAPAHRGGCGVFTVEFSDEFPGRKVAGALSAGCAIILKASEETPAGAVQLVRAFQDAGVPPGVLNLAFGTPSEISEDLIPQP